MEQACVGGAVPRALQVGLLFATCYLLLTVCYLLLVTCYLPLVTRYMLVATCYLLLRAWCMVHGALCFVRCAVCFVLALCQLSACYLLLVSSLSLGHCVSPVGCSRPNRTSTDYRRGSQVAVCARVVGSPAGSE